MIKNEENLKRLFQFKNRREWELHRDVNNKHLLYFWLIIIIEQIKGKGETEVDPTRADKNRYVLEQEGRIYKAAGR